MGHGAWGMGHGAWGMGHTSPRLKTAIDAEVRRKREEGRGKRVVNSQQSTVNNY